MKSAKWFPYLLLLLSLALPTAAAEDTVVLFPPDLTLAKEGKIKIFAFRAGGGPVPVAVNGAGKDPLKGDALQSGQADLSPGMNLLDVGGKPIRVYYMANAGADRLRILPEKGDATLEFQAYRIHPALEDGCEGCHAVDGGKLKAKGQKEACYACHDNFEKQEEGKKKYVHSPVAAGECTGCHDPHFSARSKLQKLEKGCLECHDAPAETGSVHYPVRERQCIACHGPHASNAPRQLVRSGNDLCLGCHGNPRSHHPFGAKGKQQVVALVPPDIPRNSEQFSCLACHLPHQSAERRLFRKSQGDLCRTCHPI
ncbi:MAG: cytochrome c3 family protein [Deltaproteobacteria bacterium]|nr:cytochrome c3 family protein [Deltaproteobacteria bacterium]